MKKLIMLAFVLIGLTGCGSDDEPFENDSADTESDIFSAVGVWWTNGDVFGNRLSFGEDGYFSVRIDDFIDCGMYTQDGNTITCYNPTLDRTTIYNLIPDPEKPEFSTAGIFDVTYKDLDGTPRHFNHTAVNMNYGAGYQPTKKDHPIQGNTLLLYDDIFGIVTIDFTGDYYGTQSCLLTDASKHPRKFHYICFDEYKYGAKYQCYIVYYRVLKDPTSPIIDRWTSSNQYDSVRRLVVYIANDGSLYTGNNMFTS